MHQDKKFNLQQIAGLRKSEFSMHDTNHGDIRITNRLDIPNFLIF